MTPSPANNHQVPRGEVPLFYAKDGLEAASALGCKPDPSSVLAATRELVTDCTIRYGIPPLLRRDVRSQLSLPESTTLLHEVNGQERNELWTQVVNSVRFPEQPLLPLEFDVTSETRFQGILGAISELKAETQQLTPIPEALFARLGLTHVDRLEELALSPEKDPEKRTLYANVARQLRLYAELGNAWTRITEQEMTFLEGLANFSTTSKNSRQSPERKPDESRLAAHGLAWRWKELRGSWEPAFPRSSKTEATLFDHSSHYFRIILDSTSASNWSTQLKAFLGSLQESRKDFETGEISAHGLRREQTAALERFLRKIEGA